MTEKTPSYVLTIGDAFNIFEWHCQLCQIYIYYFKY